MGVLIELHVVNKGCHKFFLFTKIFCSDNNPVLIGMDKPLEPTECKKYLNYFLPRFVRRGNRLVENLFLRYSAELFCI